ncbi:SMC-Scp complex subunit ScpB [Candidatus Woesearchaeota archaeon]|nr:SMC-Scp complex subunit ScpB [Candidatus Woesearchaeota archaeon]
MLKNKLDALLFSSGRKMSVEELSKLAKAKEDEVQAALEELKKEYHEKNSSTMLINEGNFWKLTVREQFLPLVRNIVTETELSRTIMETLAVIAFKYPIKQSDLIRIRTNKAYDHLKELEEMGYITRQKHGRTNLIKLTQKFFEYFDLPQENLREQFQDFQSIARAIEEKEKEIESIKEEQRRKAMEEEQTDERIKEQIDSLDKLENEKESENKVAESLEEENPEIMEYKEKLGSLEVVDEPSEEEQEKEKERIKGMKEEDEKILEEKEEEKKKPKFKGKGIQVSKDMEKIIDRKVERMLHPPKEEGEEAESGKEVAEKQKREVNETEEEPKDLLDASMEEKGESEEEKQ